MENNPKLGILCLDYTYPPHVGDIDHPDTFDYEVIYKKIEGLTFSLCQTGNLPKHVIKNCIDSVIYLNEKNVCGITGDCGFMIILQDIITKYTDKPVFLSSLILIPTLNNTFNIKEKIAIYTANSKNLKYLIDTKFSSLNENNRLIIIGCENLSGFEVVEKGEALNIEIIDKQLIDYTSNIIKKYPEIRCILFECTELPQFADSLRSKFLIPVYDCITACNFFMSGYLDNKNFGINGWQKKWNGNIQYPYKI